MWNVWVSAENGLAWCHNVLAQSACKSKAHIGLSVLRYDDQSKLHIDVTHSIIERNVDLSSSDAAQKVIFLQTN